MCPFEQNNIILKAAPAFAVPVMKLACLGPHCGNGGLWIRSLWQGVTLVYSPKGVTSFRVAARTEAVTRSGTLVGIVVPRLAPNWLTDQGETGHH